MPVAGAWRVRMMNRASDSNCGAAKPKSQTAASRVGSSTARGKARRRAQRRSRPSADGRGTGPDQPTGSIPARSGGLVSGDRLVQIVIAGQPAILEDRA